MKLLFDQNISYRILKKIEKEYPDSKQVRELGLENSNDIEIWKYTKLNSFTIVTFDSDFIDIANFRGHPPKIIWLRTGNTTTIGIAKILIDKFELIKDFIVSQDYIEIACLEIE